MQHSCLIQGIIPLDMPTYQRYGGKLGSNVRSRMVKVMHEMPISNTHLFSYQFSFSFWIYLKE